REATRWLASAGFEVAEADDAARAIDSFALRRADVVLADTAVGRDGLRALAEAARGEDGRTAPVVALCSGRREVGQAFDAPVADLMERPFDWRAVSLRTRSLLRFAAAEWELLRTKAEAEALRRALDEERREKAWRDTRDALTGLPTGEHLER